MATTRRLYDSPFHHRFFFRVCVAFPYFGFGLSLCVFILCVGWVFLFLLRAKAIANAIIQRFVFRSAFKAQKNAHKENWLEKAQIRPLFRHFQVANEQYSFLFVRFDGNSLNFTASTQKEFHLFTWFQYKWEEIMSYFRHWEYFATIFLIICHEMVRRAFFRKDNDRENDKIPFEMGWKRGKIVMRFLFTSFWGNVGFSETSLFKPSHFYWLNRKCLIATMQTMPSNARRHSIDSHWINNAPTDSFTRSHTHTHTECGMKLSMHYTFGTVVQSHKHSTFCIFVSNHIPIPLMKL